MKAKAAEKFEAAKASTADTITNLQAQAETAFSAAAAKADELADAAEDKFDDMKAEATVTIDLQGKSAYTDYMVVTTGRSNRHVGAVAENVVKGLKESGVKPVHVEGLTNCDWVLIDSGDVIVHVFRPEVREFYNLERMWTQPQSDAIAKPA